MYLMLKFSIISNIKKNIIFIFYYYCYYLFIYLYYTFNEFLIMTIYFGILFPSLI